MGKEIIFSFEKTSDAVQAGILMKKADPSIRYSQTRATVFVTWHANIFAASKAVLDAGIKFTPEYWEDIKNSTNR